MQRQVVPAQKDEVAFLKAIKAKLFAETQDKRSITPNLNNFDSTLEKLLLHMDEIHLQKTLAPLLRKYTLKHLRNNKIPYSRDFADSYEEIRAQSSDPNEAQLQLLTAFFSQQERAGTWATDVVAGALADLFDVNLVVTPFTAATDSNGMIIDNTEKEQTTFTIKTSANPERPYINLYVINNMHWYCYRNNRKGTFGDGNCFYNAFAQVCRQIILFEQADQNTLTLEQQLAYEEQQRLLTIFSKTPVMTMDQLVKKIQSSLTPAELADHYVALNTATTAGALANLHRKIMTLPIGDVKNRAQSLLVQIEAINEPTPLLLEVVQATNNILTEANAENISAYHKLSTRVEGQPSFQLKALAGQMLLLTTLLCVIGTLALAGSLAVSLPVTIALFSVASVSLVASVGFFAYSGRGGMAKATSDLLSAVGPQNTILRNFY